MDSKYIKKKVMKDLVEGYEVAMQLQALVHKPFDDDHTNELVAKILKSFDETISALSSCESAEGSRNPLENSCDDSAPPALYDRRFEDSGESSNRLGTTKDKRGCCKRTKKSQSRSVVAATLEDVHAWRKYGQKEILNAKFPRSYFRCTHKNSQGCKAIRQVQKLQDDPEKYKITYIGNHTCSSEQTKIEFSDMIKDSDNTWGNSYIASSNTSNDKLSKQQDLGKLTNPAVKQEEMTSDPDAVQSGDLSFVWNDIVPFEESQPMYSCNKANSYGLDMEYVLSSAVGYADHFYFDENEPSFH